MRLAHQLLLLTPLTLLAVYTYFFSDTFSGGIHGATWFTNGTAIGGTDGLVLTAANGGAVIYNGAFPNGTAEYEVKETLKMAASGRTFALYLRASNDALTGPGTQGSYYAMEMTPPLTGSGCTIGAPGAALGLLHGAAEPGRTDLHR